VEYVPPGPGEQLGHYRYRISLADGSGPWIDIAPTVRSKDAEERVREVAAERSKTAREKGLRAEDFGLKPRGSKAAPAAPTAGTTMSDWVDTWTKHRQGRGIATARECAGVWRRHIEPVIVAHVRDWTREDLRRLARTLDDRVQKSELSWKSARNVWVIATKIAADAAGSKLDAIRCRADNPASGVEGPDRGARKAEQFLYPSEFKRFVSCIDVPVEWRRAVALAIYTFVRDGELRALSWDAGDLDLEHGVLSVTRALRRVEPAKKGETARFVTVPTKTGETRRFAIEATLLPLLKAMHREAGGKGPLVVLPADHHADSLRHWLWEAGVRRPELHASSPTRKQLTWHDLRATGLTWMAVRGDDPLKIKQRAGHASFGTTELYIRTAEAVRDGFGDVFPPLPDSLLSSNESSGESSGRRGKLRKSLLRGGDSRAGPFVFRGLSARAHRVTAWVPLIHLPIVDDWRSVKNFRPGPRKNTGPTSLVVDLRFLAAPGGRILRHCLFPAVSYPLLPFAVRGLNAAHPSESARALGRVIASRVRI
jgi:integrase